MSRASADSKIRSADGKIRAASAAGFARAPSAALMHQPEGGRSEKAGARHGNGSRCSGTYCVDTALKKLFFKLGVSVARNPGYYIIIPALLTALCASGFQQMDYNYEPEYLFSPQNGRAKACESC